VAPAGWRSGRGVKSVFLLLAVMGAGLAVTAMSVAGGDRETLVPPPDAVAESFARELSERRYDLAVRYLSSDLRRSVAGTQLRQWFEPFRTRVGEPNLVSGEQEWMTDTRASARGTIDAERGTALLELRMKRESGLWTIAELPGDVPIGERESAR
jgi:hypothetical protein